MRDGWDGAAALREWRTDGMKQLARVNRGWIGLSKWLELMEKKWDGAAGWSEWRMDGIEQLAGVDRGRKGWGILLD